MFCDSNPSHALGEALSRNVSAYLVITLPATTASYVRQLHHSFQRKEAHNFCEKRTRALHIYFRR